MSLSTLGQAREGNSTSSSSIKTKKGFKLDPDRIVVGGGFGAQFGTVTYVELSPTVGYLVTDNWLAGIGGRYIYLEEKFASYSFKTNIYGGNLFTQYYFYLFEESFVAHAEYELLNLETAIGSEQRINISSVFVGGGYRAAIGESAYATILLLYNLNYDEVKSPYPDPVVFRINFGVGL